MRKGPSRSAHEKSAIVKAAKRQNRIDHFADALAEHGSTIKETARIVGISETTALGYMRTICADLGPQALGTWRIEREMDEHGNRF